MWGRELLELLELLEMPVNHAIHASEAIKQLVRLKGYCLDWLLVLPAL